MNRTIKKCTAWAFPAAALIFAIALTVPTHQHSAQFTIPTASAETEADITTPPTDGTGSWVWD
ncbi:hypothetical protein [Streptomyces prunicolor]|jgi:hypothetical protein|uniref:Secreted protein n=1 Tax=Streptomyces prunicolor TaxID=67348 RepID=A0ABU4FP56_9ACTN|nr:hypothetical protein [Streptomyces prunicolor]MCX5234591.1 hypothetical protein [Streptomyces prunicolor]MDV7222394.1 hypothetical protein [Streptomyces prunicolor]